MNNIKKWFFDHYPTKPDGPKSWVQLSGLEGDDVDGLKLEVYVNNERAMVFTGELDQWGTWIVIAANKPFTVAQEWSTRSFMEALMSGLKEFSKVCDLERKIEKQTPTYVEEEVPDTSSEK